MTLERLLDLLSECNLDEYVTIHIRVNEKPIMLFNSKAINQVMTFISCELGDMLVKNYSHYLNSIIIDL